MGGGGGRQEGEEAPASDDEVVGQLRYQVDGVDDEDGALAAVDELQHRFRTVTAIANDRKSNYNKFNHIRLFSCLIQLLIIIID